MDYESTINKQISAKKFYLVALILLVVGFAVRTIGISELPSGLNQDEASIGYEAFSILTSGADRNGNSLPVHLVSWGSGQNAMYAYLSLPFISVFGLNVFSVRIVSALFSCLSLVIFFFLLNLFFDRKKVLYALALLVICPWSIMSGRWALESNLFPVFFLAAVFFLLKGIHSSPKFYFISFLIFGLSLYTYGTSYLTVPLFLVLVIPRLIIKKEISTQSLLLSFGIFLVVSLPIFLFIIINHLHLSLIHFGPFTIPMLDSNRTTVIFNVFSDNFFLTVSKNIARFVYIMVLQVDKNAYNAIPFIGTIYLISFPFTIIGFVKTLKEKRYIQSFTDYIFLAWLICAILLGIFSQVNINRINIIYFPLLYFTVLGIFHSASLLKLRFNKTYLNGLAGIYLLFFVFFAVNYTFIFREESKTDFAFGLGNAIEYIEKEYKNLPVNISANSINMPYIYVCFYTAMNAEVFRKTVLYKEYEGNGFKEVSSVGRYSFENSTFSKNGVNIFDLEAIKLKGLKVSDAKKFGNFYVYPLR